MVCGCIRNIFKEDDSFTQTLRKLIGLINPVLALLSFAYGAYWILLGVAGDVGETGVAAGTATMVMGILYILLSLGLLADAIVLFVKKHVSDGHSTAQVWILLLPFSLLPICVPEFGCRSLLLWVSMVAALTQSSHAIPQCVISLLAQLVSCYNTAYYAARTDVTPTAGTSANSGFLLLLPGARIGGPSLEILGELCGSIVLANTIVIAVFVQARAYSDTYAEARKGEEAQLAVKMAREIVRLLSRYDTDGVGELVEEYRQSTVDPELLDAFTQMRTNLENYRPHLPNYCFLVDDEGSSDGGDTGIDDTDDDNNDERVHVTKSLANLAAMRSASATNDDDSQLANSVMGKTDCPTFGGSVNQAGGSQVIDILSDERKSSASNASDLSVVEISDVQDGPKRKSNASTGSGLKAASKKRDPRPEPMFDTSIGTVGSSNTTPAQSPARGHEYFTPAGTSPARGLGGGAGGAPQRGFRRNISYAILDFRNLHPKKKIFASDLDSLTDLVNVVYTTAASTLGSVHCLVADTVHITWNVQNKVTTPEAKMAKFLGKVSRFAKKNGYLLPAAGGSGAARSHTIISATKQSASVVQIPWIGAVTGALELAQRYKTVIIDEATASAANYEIECRVVDQLTYHRNPPPGPPLPSTLLLDSKENQLGRGSLAGAPIPSFSRSVITDPNHSVTNDSFDGRQSMEVAETSSVESPTTLRRSPSAASSDIVSCLLYEVARDVEHEEDEWMYQLQKSETMNGGNIQVNTAMEAIAYGQDYARAQACLSEVEDSDAVVDKELKTNALFRRMVHYCNEKLTNPQNHSGV